MFSKVDVMGRGVWKGVFPEADVFPHLCHVTHIFWYQLDFLKLCFYLFILLLMYFEV